MNAHKLAEILLAGPDLPVVLRDHAFGPTEVQRVEDCDMDYWAGGEHKDGPHLRLGVIPLSKRHESNPTP